MSNIQQLYDAVEPLPEIALRSLTTAWSGAIVPVCQKIHETLHDDVEHLVQVLADLEPPYEPVIDNVSQTTRSFSSYSGFTFPSSSQTSHSRYSVRTSCHIRTPRSQISGHIRRRSLRVRDGNLSRYACFHVIFSPLVPDAAAFFNQSSPCSNDSCAEPSDLLPIIMITPCPSEPHDTSCLVPYQDAAFGLRLTVPAHPVLNEVFPPLVTKPFPLVENWRYENGHWRALLPSLEEQVTKGMFSRPIATRRLPRTSCSRNAAQKRVSYARGTQRME